MGPKAFKPFKPGRIVLNLRSRSSHHSQDAQDGQPADDDDLLNIDIEEDAPQSPPAPLPRSLQPGHPPASEDAPPILYPEPAYTYQLRPRPSRTSSGSAHPQAPASSPHRRPRTRQSSVRDDAEERPASRSGQDEMAPPNIARRPTPFPTSAAPPAASRPPRQADQWQYNLRGDDVSSTMATESAAPPQRAPQRAPPQVPASQPTPLQPAAQITSAPTRPAPRQDPQDAGWRFNLRGDDQTTTVTESTTVPQQGPPQPSSGQPAAVRDSGRRSRPTAGATQGNPGAQGAQNREYAGGDPSIPFVSFDEWDVLTRARPAGPWSLDWWPEGLNYTPPEQWKTRHFWSGELHLDWTQPDPDDPWIPCLHCKKAHWFLSTQKNPGAKFFKCPFNRHPEDCRMFSYEGPLRADGKIKLCTVTFPPGIEPDRYPPANLIVRPPERIDPRVEYIRDMRNRENQRRYNEFQERFRQARLDGDRLRAEDAARQASRPAGPPPLDPNVGAEHYTPGESPLPPPVPRSPLGVEPPSPSPAPPPRAARRPPPFKRTDTAAFKSQYSALMEESVPVPTSHALSPRAGPPAQSSQSSLHGHESSSATRVPAQPSASEPSPDDQMQPRKEEGKGKGKAAQKRPAEEELDDAPPPQRQRRDSSGPQYTGSPVGPPTWHGSHTWPVGLAPDPEYVRRDLAALASLPGPQTRLTLLHLAASILADPNVLPDGTRAEIENALNHEIDEEGRRVREDESRRQYDDWANANHRAPRRE
ncbi:hypothetical protein CALVIDRAFT_569029 [Calocera viscosa TUFC12733]|uniref:Zinc finger GRF-type domain-containing protein n=1 Tax=Calocera viscosa (strain TUFC12733) TaxID=1330018 RepID=A0A167GG43_CALVF|nr:hypothetical protein CALVIDRAFT_569029 [Calocera viscosa TUFC12733]